MPVIFITAYPERFLTGERPEPAFLIAKPFQPSTVSAVFSQALVLRAQRQAAGTQGELERGDAAGKKRKRVQPSGGIFVIGLRPRLP